jgi:hypothetical protein
MAWFVFINHATVWRIADNNRQVTSTIPTWQAECARPEKRGRVIILAGAIISGGVMIVSISSPIARKIGGVLSNETMCLTQSKLGLLDRLWILFRHR